MVGTGGDGVDETPGSCLLTPHPHQLFDLMIKSSSAFSVWGVQLHPSPVGIPWSWGPHHHAPALGWC